MGAGVVRSSRTGAGPVTAPKGQERAVPDEGAASPRCMGKYGPARWGYGDFGHNAEPTCAICGGTAVKGHTDWREGRMLRTVEQLDALPPSAVVRAGGAVLEAASRPGQQANAWVGAGGPYRRTADEVPLPALLLWTPDGSA